MEKIAALMEVSESYLDTTSDIYFINPSLTDKLTNVVVDWSVSKNGILPTPSQFTIINM